MLKVTCGGALPGTRRRRAFGLRSESERGTRNVRATVHMVLGLVLTGVLVCQVRALAAVVRSRRTLASQRTPRVTDLVWIAIPVAVVLLLAARSWIVALAV